VIILKRNQWARSQWLTPVILATQEAEIRRIEVRSQPGQIVGENLPQKNPPQNRAGGVAQGVDLEFKPQYCTHTSTKKSMINTVLAPPPLAPTGVWPTCVGQVGPRAPAQGDWFLPSAFSGWDGGWGGHNIRHVWALSDLLLPEAG
jgi:hypothetical protein